MLTAPKPTQKDPSLQFYQNYSQRRLYSLSKKEKENKEREGLSPEGAGKLQVRPKTILKGYLLTKRLCLTYTYSNLIFLIYEENRQKKY